MILFGHLLHARSIVELKLLVLEKAIISKPRNHHFKILKSRNYPFQKSEMKTKNIKISHFRNQKSEITISEIRNDHFIFTKNITKSKSELHHFYNFKVDVAKGLIYYIIYHLFNKIQFIGNILKEIVPIYFKIQ